MNFSGFMKFRVGAAFTSYSLVVLFGEITSLLISSTGILDRVDWFLEPVFLLFTRLMRFLINSLPLM